MTTIASAFTQLPRDQNNVIKYRCVCGSVLRAGSRSGHLSTKKHEVYLERNSVVTPSVDLRPQREEIDYPALDSKHCNICYKDCSNMIFTSCKTCKKEICMKCEQSLIRPTCPYCRTNLEKKVIRTAEYSFSVCGIQQITMTLRYSNPKCSEVIPDLLAAMDLFFLSRSEKRR